MATLRDFVAERFVYDAAWSVGVTEAYLGYLGSIGLTAEGVAGMGGMTVNRFSREVRRIGGGRIGLRKSGVKRFAGIRWATEEERAAALARGSVI